MSLLREFHTKLCGFNIDEAKVNTGIHKGLTTLLCEESPWSNVVHCFNHRFELALKYTFENTFFDGVDMMLTKIYYMYTKKSKKVERAT